MKMYWEPPISEGIAAVIADASAGAIGVATM